MSFTQMLLALAAQSPPPIKATKLSTEVRYCQNANDARHKRAVERYKAVMGTDWVRTKVIESRLGYVQSACYDALNSYLKLGIIERRPVGGGVFIRIKGYEWRWKS